MYNTKGQLFYRYRDKENPCFQILGLDKAKITTWDKALGNELFYHRNV